MSHELWCHTGWLAFDSNCVLLTVSYLEGGVDIGFGNEGITI